MLSFSVVCSRGTWFPLLNRIVLSCCWYGVEGWYGGQVVKIMIGAIWRTFEYTCLEAMLTPRSSFLLHDEEPFPSICSNEDE
jgi:cytosine/uracil/thiamine/allantoin permease